MMKNYKKWFIKSYLFLLILLPFVLIVLPSDFFDKGNSICISKLLLNQSCPGCGITKAIQHLIHFDFSVAMEYNKLSIIVAPLLFLILLHEISRIKKTLMKNKKLIGKH